MDVEYSNSNKYIKSSTLHSVTVIEAPAIDCPRKIHDSAIMDATQENSEADNRSVNPESSASGAGYIPKARAPDMETGLKKCHKDVGSPDPTSLPQLRNRLCFFVHECGDVSNSEDTVQHLPREDRSGDACGEFGLEAKSTNQVTSTDMELAASASSGHETQGQRLPAPCHETDHFRRSLGELQVHCRCSRSLVVSNSLRVDDLSLSGSEDTSFGDADEPHVIEFTSDGSESSESSSFEFPGFFTCGFARHYDDGYFISEEETDTALVECAICCTEVPERIMKHTKCCASNVCLLCWEGYIVIKLQNGNVYMECPMTDCHHQLPEAEVTSVLGVQQRKLYFKLLTDKKNLPHVKTCPRCGTITEVPESSVFGKKARKVGLKVCCPDCQLSWCFPCQAPWHEGRTCKQFLLGDQQFLAWAKDRPQLQANARCCPRCMAYVQRSEGCAHMVCPRCGTDFCYDCGKTAYGAGHSTHYRLRQLGRLIMGHHNSRMGVRGCSQNYLPHHPARRRLIRGSLCGAKLVGGAVVGTGLGAVVLGAGAVAVGVVVSVGAVVLPVVGAVMAGKRIRQKVRETQKRRTELDGQAETDGAREGTGASAGRGELPPGISKGADAVLVSFRMTL